MSMKSLQGRRTPGLRYECRTASDGRRPLHQAHGLEPLISHIMLGNVDPTTHCI